MLRALLNWEQRVFGDTGPHGSVISIPRCSASWMSSEEEDSWEDPSLSNLHPPCCDGSPLSASGPFRAGGQQLEAGHLGRDSEHISWRLSYSSFVDLIFDFLIIFVTL